MILNAVPINESYHDPSLFDHFGNSQTNCRFFDTSCDRKIMGGKSKQSLEGPNFTCELYVLQGQSCVSACVGKLFMKCLLLEFSVLSLRLVPFEKMKSPVIFDPDYSFKW